MAPVPRVMAQMPHSGSTHSRAPATFGKLSAVSRRSAAPAHDLDALRALYAEVESALAGWSCDASTDCCHFGRTGREPYLWPNEWALLERALRGRPLPRAALGS